MDSELWTQFETLWPGLLKLELPAIAATVMWVVRLYRQPGVQEVLPARLRWPSEPAVGFIVVGLISALATFAAALLSGLTIKAAAVGIIPVLLQAVLAHKGTQAVAAQVRAPSEPVPVSLSRPMSLMVNTLFPAPKLPEKK